MKDEELKSLIKQQIRQDAGNPYFMRKVLNRLPEKQRTEPCFWILRIAYLIAAVLIAAFWWQLVFNGEMFGKNLPDFIVLWSLTLMLCFAWLQGMGNTDAKVGRLF